MGRTAYLVRGVYTGRGAFYAATMLPPIENRDPGDETVDDES